MPRGDRTGPWGLGPMTGRAAGYCAGYAVPGFMNPMPGFGRGFGFGRGWGRGWWAYPRYSYEFPYMMYPPAQQLPQQYGYPPQYYAYPPPGYGHFYAPYPWFPTYRYPYTGYW